MSKGKNLNTFWRQMEAVVFIIIQIFSTPTAQILKLGKITRIFLIFSWDIFYQVKSLN